MNIETLLQHLGEEEHYAGAVTPPIFQTSLFVHESVADFKSKHENELERPKGYVYSRVGNPNLNMVEAKVAALEKTEECRIFCSGMAAISAAILSVIESGAHIVCVDTAYGPTQMFLRDYLPKFNVETTFVEGLSVEEVLDAVQDNTKLIYLESPGSILFRIQDFRRICEFAKSRGIKTITDNSYSSPIFQQPATMGVDLVVHSATKYLVGHSDVVAGVVAGTKADLNHIMKFEGQLLGGLLPPFPAWLMLRGMRTLKIRMMEAQRMGNVMAKWLKSRPEVETLYHAGDPDHPQLGLIEQQMQGSTSLISFMPKIQNEKAIHAFLDALKVFQLGVSWGGYESLAVGLEMKTLSWESPRWIIRLYCGLENEADLQADLEQAIANLRD